MQFGHDLVVDGCVGVLEDGLLELILKVLDASFILKIQLQVFHVEVLDRIDLLFWASSGSCLSLEVIATLAASVGLLQLGFLLLFLLLKLLEHLLRVYK